MQFKLPHHSEIINGTDTRLVLWFQIKTSVGSPVCGENQNHQLNWWFASALKGLITGQRLKTHRMVRQSHYFYRPPLKRPVFLCLGILTTCKRVKVLFHRYLIRCNVFLQLVLYVFSNRLRITAYGIHIVPTTPKMSVPVFVL